MYMGRRGMEAVDTPVIVYRVMDENCGSFLTKASGLYTICPIGKRVYPYVGKLFAFTSVGDAKMFIADTDRVGYVYRCFAQKSVDQHYQIAVSSITDSVRFVRRGWKLQFSGSVDPDPIVYHTNLVKGTIFCDWIQTIEKVDTQSKGASYHGK